MRGGEGGGVRWVGGYLEFYIFEFVSCPASDTMGTAVFVLETLANPIVTGEFPH